MYNAFRHADISTEAPAGELKAAELWLIDKWPRSLAAPRVVNIGDLRNLAQRRLPRAVFDYLDGGAESEITLRENCHAFESLTFRPRNAMSVPECDTRVKVLGAELSFPAILAPIGYSRLIHPEGEWP